MARKVVAGTLITFLIVWTSVVITSSPTKIVEAIGVERTYAALFLLGALGGLSFLTSASFYTVLFTFATGGSNPLLLGLMGGLGLTIGDGIYFLTGRQSHALFTPRIDEWSTHISQRITKLPTAFIPIGVFIYAAFTPLPNDILMITLALTDVTYSHVLVPLVLGNITLITALSIGVVVW